MVQGTGSHTGKSVIVTALCRIFARDGWRVAPYKSQNMSLNSYVTPQGGEMGRAQVLQAQAAGIDPHTDMNPILLKPASDERAQVILNGRPVGHMEAGEYHHLKLTFLPQALEALERLRATCDIVVIEGAGSPAEINLADQDIANMRIAEAADAPVILVGDIDRGGVFASLVGTLELLNERERELVAGFIINKFRGSADLLQGGLDFLEERTDRPVLGVLPYIRDLGLEEEDTVNLEELRYAAGREAAHGVDIAVVHLPHISNATDLDPLARLEGVRLRYVSEPSLLGTPDAVILPGSKSTASDLSYLRGNGMAAQIIRLAHLGVPVIGICGGYQMLGERIEDPQGVESLDGGVEGMGLLPVSTTLAGAKSTHRVKARVTKEVPFLGIGLSSPPLTGYEIHMGFTRADAAQPLLIVERDGREVSVADGAVHADLPVFGCYLHGLFENSAMREGFVNRLRLARGLPPVSASREWDVWREDRLDRLARITRASLHMPAVYSLLGITGDRR
ncbi:MAG: cobyric acid synthase [Actinobacteria bacterium]|jgi:adenosylcobyric acid synthase|nr:MAG: cobyric acid synthase [Actinomycetota bacterium]